MINKNINKKRAAMEMSVGTLVTIVLLMVVLVLGIVLVRTIFTSGTNAVNEIDAQVQDQINKLFADEATKFVVYPPSREISVEQGDTGGVGFSMRNTGELGPGSKSFTYTVTATDIENGCGMSSLPEANKLITLGQTGTYSLNAGHKMDQAALIKFSVPKVTPLCLIRYQIKVISGSTTYGQTDFDLKIVS